MLRKVLMLFLVAVMAVSAFANAEGEGGGGDRSKRLKDMQKFTIFLGYDNKESYPSQGTIFGNWLEEQTGVYIEWEILVGDLEQKVSIIAASGDYQDAIAARNRTYVIYDAGAFIPLNDLLDQYGQDILKLWGKNRKLLVQDDGEIYWMPQTMPYGTKVRKTQESHGVYIQKTVLEEYGYPKLKNLEEALDLLVKYAKKYPEINGNKTYAWTTLIDGWRDWPLMNTPSVMTGHPNDGKGSVDWVDGKWKVTPIGFDQDAYELYKLYNKVYLEGVYDPECFVMNYDQYIAKLTTGSILGFYDQWWNFEQAQKILKDAGEDRWYVSLPLVRKGYTEGYEGPLEPQATEGLGITVDCKDPVSFMKYFNFLAKEDVVLKRNWGMEGVDYLVDSKGMYYRTPEMVEKWDDLDWAKNSYGADYWANFLYPNPASLMPDGKNSVAPGNQPSIYRLSLKPEEIEVLDAYKQDTFATFFRDPDPKRALYFPLWSVNFPAGGELEVGYRKMLDLRIKYFPLLIMADKGTYDKVWKDFMAEYVSSGVKDIVPKVNAYLQKEIDKRAAINGGYDMYK
jgi:putative aldouronate transport system substrate-binding protein